MTELLPDATQIAKTMLKHVIDDTTEMAPSQFRVPVSEYSDAELFEREVRQIFKTQPLILGFSAEVPEIGSYRAREFMGIPVLIVRGTDKVARAFLNVCRHRGNIVAEEGSGKSRLFTCVYHGWTYSCTGKLVSVPHEEHFGSVDRSTMGLTQLPTEERDGVIYGVLDPHGELKLTEWLGETGDIIKGFGLQTLKFFYEFETPGPNWKLVMNAHQEVYHFRTLHRDSLANVIAPDVMRAKPCGPHLVGNFVSNDIVRLKDIPETEWKPSEYFGTVVYIFPNAQISPFPQGTGRGAGYKGGLVSFERVFPGKTVDTSVTITTIMVTEPFSTDEQRTFAESTIAVLRTAIENEDYKVAWRIQSALKSGANDALVFGRNEPCLQHWHRTIARLVPPK